MFIDKKTSYPKLKTYAVDFSNFSGGLNTKVDESILPLRYARKAYNFCYEDGVLKQGLGIEKLTFPLENYSDVEAVVHFPKIPFSAQPTRRYKALTRKQSLCIKP